MEYLRIWEDPIDEQKILVCQINNEGKFNFCETVTLGFFGIHFSYKIESPYINNKICTPIISLSKDSFGDVIAIKHNKSKLKGENIHQALNINIIFRCINGLVHQNKISPSETLSEAKKLSPVEIHVLAREGLKNTENENVFISPGSQGITPLWFYRTHCAWFWTPTEPKNFTLEELIKCNWSLIQGNFPIKAIGGLWNNMALAERNIALIEYLIKSGLRFLLG